MTRCYPPNPDFAQDRDAERVVWEALRDQLPDEAALFYSVQLKEGPRESEADLVVGWPGVGIAVMEVKGGLVSYRNAEWRQSGRHGSHRIDDPVEQAQSGKHMLLRFLQPRSTVIGATRAAHLVAFPFTAVPADWETPGCSRAMVLGKGDLPRSAAILRTAIDDHGINSGPLSEAGGDHLIELLTAQLGGQTSLLSMAEEHELRVDRMTRAQADLLKSLRLQRRMKVIGGAGTGKTWLALEQARRLAGDGERVALVCYSRGLARHFQLETASWPAKERPAYVGLFHALPLQWGASAPPAADMDAAAQSEYYETLLPDEMGRLAAALTDVQRYDSIVVDEAQDFGDAWWPPTLACLRGGENAGLFAFLDEAQRVFNRRGEVPIALPPYPLGENIRNTRRIAQTFGSLAKEQDRYLGLDGPPVRFVPCAAAEATDVADEQIDGLIDEGWAPGQIALLTTGRRHTEQSQTVDAFGSWDTYWDEFFAGTDVFYGHVLGFKGLERPVVVLAVNGIRDKDRAREYLYVGLSRARTQLVVCGDLDEITEYGGRGLRKRLERSGA